MKKYKVFRVSNNKLLSEWTSVFADETHYEENWGKAAYEESVFDVDGITIIETIQHPDEYVIIIEDITVQHEKDTLKQEMLAKGARARAVCQDCLDIIAGFNIDRVLTGAQVTQMQQTFGTIEALLRANRPASAKPLIEALTPDGVLVTQEMKSVILDVLAEV